MSQEPWYKKDGLRFQCSQCGDCCTGAPGFVWVNADEIRALAERVTGGDVEEFERLYVRKVGVRKSLVEFPNGDCAFFDTQSRRCTVYDARPRQCRTWPFWDSNLKTPEDWQRTCQVCPGSGRGELYELQVIEEQRKAVRV
jgi:Fe-S-cluster containining protein